MIKVEMCRNGSSLNLLKQREKGRVSTHGKKSTMFCLFAALSDALRAEIQRLKGVTGVSKTSNGNANLLQSNCSQFHLPQSQFPQHTGQYRYSNQTQGQTHSPSTTMTE